eukprot:CAMPEP_0170269150 /NCGR_PEP_ID=MMETSP0116_2-20130129/34509_1 /TAXON_ID=400756 /ORGANISM="Durinskia baltica, Strain CSIRO CS-38" /LENGTH=215 /DNA_ID=CAMNT_0010520321 /DNA_START=87 /DNA_END=734 /DNA_ORIENTATION=+
MTIANLPQLPLVCLKTADSKDTQQVVRGKPTIIDFWTTKCTRCPDALDKLDQMASDPKYENVQFISICCDQLDGARQIIEKDDDLRWQNVDHYFMSESDKEQAKKELGFKSVPFYVVLDEQGQITQKGNHNAIDFEEVPGVVRPEPVAVQVQPTTTVLEPERCEGGHCLLSCQGEEKMEDDMMDDFALDFQLDFSLMSVKDPPKVDRIFTLEDDF